MREIWKDVKGFEGIYQISSKGRLLSFKQHKQGKIMSITNSKGNYLSVVLCYKDQRCSTRVHRLVAETFIPNPDNKPQVNHKDGNKQNNEVSNLEWCTIAENVKHAIKMNPQILENMNYYNTDLRTKTIYQYSLNGELIASFLNSKEAQKRTGVCQRNILQVASKDEYKPGKIRKQAGGYIWSYERKGVVV